MSAQDIVTAASPYLDSYQYASQQYGIPESILVAQGNVESGFDPSVINGKRVSTAGAIGIAQFLPSTARWATTVKGNPLFGLTFDPANAAQSILEQSWYDNYLGGANNINNALEAYSGNTPGYASTIVGTASQIASLLPSTPTGTSPTGLSALPLSGGSSGASPTTNSAGIGATLPSDSTNAVKTPTNPNNPNPIPVATGIGGFFNGLGSGINEVLAPFQTALNADGTANKTLQFVAKYFWIILIIVAIYLIKRKG